MFALLFETIAFFFFFNFELKCSRNVTLRSHNIVDAKTEISHMSTVSGYAVSCVVFERCGRAVKTG